MQQASFNEQYARPKVSIVMPVYNNFELTKHCIDSINNAKLKTNYEIIIADDCSTDETQNIEKYYSNVKLIRPDKNLGFLLNVKNAIQHAKGEYIFLMNNDMIVKPRFLDYLYNTISRNKNIGIVGAMMLNKNGTIQEAGGTVFVDGSAAWNYNKYKKINTTKTFNVDYCSGCGIMFSKKDWDELGGFDERFAPAYYEDTDFCFQIKYNLGKQVVCQPKAQIYHFHGKTYNEDLYKLCNTNRAKFIEKWGNKLYKTQETFKNEQQKQLFNYGEFIKNIFSIQNCNIHKVVTILGVKLKIKSKKLTARKKIENEILIARHHYGNTEKLNIKLDYLDLMIKKNLSKQNNTILYIDWHIFEPDTNAGDRASYSYFKALLNSGYNIIYLPYTIEKNTKPKYFDLIKDYGVEILTSSDGRLNQDYIKSWLQKNGKFINYVFINRPNSYEKYEEYINKYLGHTKKIYQGHDIHHLRLLRMAEVEQGKTNNYKIESIKKTELDIWQKMDMILYFSDKEIDIVKSYYPDANALAVPLFLYSEIEKINYNPRERKDLLFVGGFNHTPNVDAMKWFIKDIFPTVLKTEPNIKLHIVGPNCPKDIIDLKNENIILHGYVSDDVLLNTYSQTKIVISPLRYGAGVKGKIIEAIKNQIPVITTDIGAEGINSDLLTIANSEESFAKAILDLYNADERLTQISKESYYYIKENFSEKFINKLMKFIDNF